jgi:hypothetical protein
MISLLLFAAAALPQGDPAQATPREERLRQFVKAFFGEDEKTLLALSSGRLKSDLEAYFWIRRKLDGEKAAPREWKGELKILKSVCKKVLSLDAELREEEMQVFEITVDGTAYHCGIDDRNTVALFGDSPK